MPVIAAYYGTVIIDINKSLYDHRYSHSLDITFMLSGAVFSIYFFMVMAPLHRSITFTSQEIHYRNFLSKKTMRYENILKVTTGVDSIGKYIILSDGSQNIKIHIRWYNLSWYAAIKQCPREYKQWLKNPNNTAFLKRVIDKYNKDHQGRSLFA